MHISVQIICDNNDQKLTKIDSTFCIRFCRYKFCQCFSTTTTQPFVWDYAGEPVL